MTRKTRHLEATISFPPFRFNNLQPVQSPKSPLNHYFLLFVAFCVPKGNSFNSICLTHSTHRSFQVSIVERLFWLGSQDWDQTQFYLPKWRKARGNAQAD
jgi:hypothetical protein